MKFCKHDYPSNYLYIRRDKVSLQQGAPQLSSNNKATGQLEAVRTHFPLR